MAWNVPSTEQLRIGGWPRIAAGRAVPRLERGASPGSDRCADDAAVARDCGAGPTPAPHGSDGRTGPVRV